MRLRDDILSLVRKYRRVPAPFVPGKTLIPATMPVYGEAEIANAIEAAMEFRPAAGRWSVALEKKLATWFFGSKRWPTESLVSGTPAGFARLTNSGSSANLLALAALTSPELGGLRLTPGDEVITIAAGFPTTISPIVRLGMTPVFVDVRPFDYNVDVDQLKEAASSRTRAVIFAHTLGSPFDVKRVKDFCLKRGLWLIEDCCDAMGARVNGGLVGTFGDLSTLSFYPAHHMTTGEGGAVLTADPLLDKIVTSLRDWGRDCYCMPGRDNTCGKRFDQTRDVLGGLPDHYDHKFTYSHLGFNLKMTDMQAAIGCAQIERVGGFVQDRRTNWQRLWNGLWNCYNDEITIPDIRTADTNSPFGFLITAGSAKSRVRIVSELEKRKIATRPLFAGNMIHQPAISSVPVFRVAGSLDGTDMAESRAFWIGCHPGLTKEMLDYVIASFHKIMGHL